MNFRRLASIGCFFGEIATQRGTIRRFAAVFLLLVASGLWPHQARADGIRIVALGDSLMAGFALPPGESFPARLEAALKAKGHQVTIVNAGVSGDTSRGGRSRLDWSVDKTADAVLVELGANDALRGIDPKSTRANLDAIIDKLKASGKAILLVGMQAPPNMGDDYKSKFDQIYPDLAEKHGVLLYGFFLDGVASFPDLNLADGKHPNEKGIAVMVKRMLPIVEQLIAEVKQGRS